MEVWIDNNEIIDRIYNRISDLSEEIKLRYINSNICIEFNEIVDGNSALTHDFIIDFCILTNTSYKYLMLGQTPIYDDEKNNLYKRLIAKKDYTI